MRKETFRLWVDAVAGAAVDVAKAEDETITQDTLSDRITKQVHAAIAGEAPAADGVPKEAITLSKVNEQELPQLIHAAVAKQFEQFKSEQEGEAAAEAAIAKMTTNAEAKRMADASPTERAAHRKAPINEGGADDGAMAFKTIESMPLSKRAQRPANQFNLLRLIKAHALGDWQAIQVEKALSGQQDESGGFTVPDVIMDGFVDVLREKVIVQAAGARVQPMTSATLGIPVLEEGTSVNWRGLQGQTITESNTPKFNLANLIAHDLTALIPIPFELLDDSSLRMEELVIQDMAKAMGNEEDRSWLVGQGTDEPIGITNFPGVTAVSEINLDAINIDTVRALILQTRLALSKATAILTHPTVTDRLMSLKDANGRPLLTPDLHEPDQMRMHGIPILDSANCIDTDDKFKIIVAPMDEIIIGERTPIDIASDGSVGFKENNVWVRGLRRVDLTIARPATVTYQTIANP